MTREEFNNLKVGDIIVAYHGRRFRVESIDRDMYPARAYYISSLKNNDPGYACMPENWKLGNKIIELGGKYDNRGV